MPYLSFPDNLLHDNHIVFHICGDSFEIGHKIRSIFVECFFPLKLATNYREIVMGGGEHSHMLADIKCLS